MEIRKIVTFVVDGVLRLWAFVTLVGVVTFVLRLWAQHGSICVQFECSNKFTPSNLDPEPIRCDPDTNFLGERFRSFLRPPRGGFQRGGRTNVFSKNMTVKLQKSHLRRAFIAYFRHI